MEQMGNRESGKQKGDLTVLVSAAQPLMLVAACTAIVLTPNLSFNANVRFAWA